VFALAGTAIPASAGATAIMAYVVSSKISAWGHMTWLADVPVGERPTGCSPGISGRSNPTTSKGSEKE
jgi:hypothetical protein